MHDWLTLALHQQCTTWKKGWNDPIISLMSRMVLQCSACSKHLSNTYWTNIKQKNITTLLICRNLFSWMHFIKVHFCHTFSFRLKDEENFRAKIKANKIKVVWGTGLEGINTSSLTTTLWMLKFKFTLTTMCFRLGYSSEYCLVSD